ncbi:hypothetical protein J1614_010317 [Plenodomus biglobosus]|nr:hypothetical protein J1614_010317 [Plenodomus biglobosus]
MATTTISSNMLTPTRRVSRKYGDFGDKSKTTNEEFNEKDIFDYQYPISESTAHDLQTASPSRSIDNTPTRPRPSLIPNTYKDIEGQRDVEFHTGAPSWREKLVEYTLLFLIILVWMLLIMGVLILTDTLFPTALRSYHKLKELRAGLAETNFELEALKAKMFGLYQSVGHVGALTIQTLRR